MSVIACRTTAHQSGPKAHLGRYAEAGACVAIVGASQGAGRPCAMARSVPAVVAALGVQEIGPPKIIHHPCMALLISPDTASCVWLFPQHAVLLQTHAVRNSAVATQQACQQETAHSHDAAEVLLSGKIPNSGLRLAQYRQQRCIRGARHVQERTCAVRRCACAKNAHHCHHHPPKGCLHTPRRCTSCWSSSACRCLCDTPLPRSSLPCIGTTPGPPVQPTPATAQSPHLSSIMALFCCLS